MTLIDAWGASHSRASSGGESRLTRAGYGKDAVYTRMASDSLPQWQALSAVSGLPILIPNGVVFFSAVEDDYFRGSIDVHRQLGLPIERMDRATMQGRFPMIDFEGIEVGLFEARFGALMARRSVQTLVDRFVRAGGEYRLGAAVPVQASGSELQGVKLQSGETIAADRFVFALGPWLPKIFPDVLGKKIFATRQEVFYFATPPGEKIFSPAAMPGWADFNAGDIFYGFPDLENRGVKFANDKHGVLVDPDTQDRRPTQAAIDEIIAFRDRRFPKLRGAQLIGAEVCQYENSSNGDFLIDVHPTLANVLLVGGGSGHGFKHGPEVGRYAAARLFGAVKVGAALRPRHQGRNPAPRGSLSNPSASAPLTLHSRMEWLNGTASRTIDRSHPAGRGGPRREPALLRGRVQCPGHPGREQFAQPFLGR